MSDAYLETEAINTMSEIPDVFDTGSYPAVNVEDTEKGIIITITGYFSCGYEDQLKLAIFAAAEKKPKEILIDFSKVEWMCSCFIGVLIEGLKRCRELEINLVLARIPARLMPKFQQGCLVHMFEIRD